jgi:diguanylate cyclase (GGDEF)-like protein/PAS domain S-box-containing protein
LVTALVLGLALVLILDGARLTRLERNAEAQTLASAAAEGLAFALRVEQERMRSLLAAQRPAIEVALSGAPRGQPPAALESLLRGRLPGLLSVDIEQSAAAADDTWLTVVDGAAVIRHRMRLADEGADLHRLSLSLRCGAICESAVPIHPGLQAQLVSDNGGRAALGAMPENRPANPNASFVADLSAVPEPLALASAEPPGAPDWSIEVFALADGPVASRLLLRLATGMLLVSAALATAFSLFRAIRRERRWADAEGQRSRDYQRKLGALLDACTDGILLTTAVGRIELLNPAAELMFGQLRDDLLGSEIAELLPELLRDDSVRTPPNSVAAALPLMRDLTGVRVGGEAFPVRVWVRHLLLDTEPCLLLVVQDLTEQTHQAKQLQFLEQNDVLTGLLNRREFERRMQRILSAAAGSEGVHVLCYIDIDQFKLVNDTAGHAAGDALVEQLATLFKAQLNDAALIGRLGGDEFAALFSDRSEAQALAACEGLMQTVRNFLFTWRDRSFDIAISIGLTAFLPDHDSAAIELAKADVACHMAKREGRDRIHVYHDGDAAVARHHGEMYQVSVISKALNRGRFRLYSQPIMPLAAGSTRRTHYEILLRMLDERGELVEPDQFIPAAERYILMPAVDRWVIHQLFSTQGEQLRTWHAENPQEFLFAVNLSGTSVNDESFLPFLRRQFEAFDIPPSGICFEITETAALRNLGDARGFIHQLAKLGCTFALDDFGSGLSSYSYLRELPVKYLKIDGSFVRDMNSNPVNHALVASINQIAHVLGLQTIAEWAEDDSTINQLRALNVDFAQGYAIGTPLPVVESGADIMNGLVHLEAHNG